jgi:raffinose/stachyose/melibiose transport system permease protein
MTSLSKPIKISHILAHILLISYSITVIFPIILVVFNSFKSTKEIFSSPYGLPSSLSFVNYINAWETANFAVYFKNSIFVTSVSVFLILFVSSMAAYVLARFQFKGNLFIYFMFIVGLMLPMRLAIIPLFLLLRDLGLLDSYTGLILVYVASGLPFSIFILYTFFKSIPEELAQAARVEGCNSFQIYYMIMLPLVRPALSTVAIFNFIGLWNDFFFPFILLRNPDLYTLPVGISKFFGEYSTDWASLFAGLSLSILPVVLVFFILSKQFIEGLTAGAVK